MKYYLNEIKKDQKVVICKNEIIDSSIKLRIEEIGFVKGTKIEVLKNSILNQNLLISVRGSTVSMSSYLAKYILVEIC